MILANKAKKPKMVITLGLKPRLCMKGKLYPPKKKVAMTAEDINILMYSANR